MRAESDKQTYRYYRDHRVAAESEAFFSMPGPINDEPSAVVGNNKRRKHKIQTLVMFMMLAVVDEFVASFVRDERRQSLMGHDL